MSNKQIHQLTAQGALDSTFVIPVQKADGSESATKITIESLKEPLGIADLQVYKTVKVTLSSSQILDLFTKNTESELRFEIIKHITNDTITEVLFEDTTINC